MKAKSKLRGHEIEHNGHEWVFTDTGDPTVKTWRDRPCGHCGKYSTFEGYDACLGYVTGVINACCGHGVRKEAYVQFPNRKCVRGIWALLVIWVKKVFK